MSAETSTEESILTVFGRWMFGWILIGVGLLVLTVGTSAIYYVFFTDLFRNWYGIANIAVAVILIAGGSHMKAGTTTQSRAILDVKAAMWSALTCPKMFFGILLVVLAANLAVAGLVGWVEPFHSLVSAVTLGALGIVFMRNSI